MQSRLGYTAALATTLLFSSGCNDFGPGKERYECVALVDPGLPTGGTASTGTVCARNMGFARIKCCGFPPSTDCDARFEAEDCSDPVGSASGPLVGDADAFVMVDPDSDKRIVLDPARSFMRIFQGDTVFAEFFIGGEVDLDGTLSASSSVLLKGVHLFASAPSVSLADGTVGSNAQLFSSTQASGQMNAFGNSVTIFNAQLGMSVRIDIDDPSNGDPAQTRVIQALNTMPMHIAIDPVTGAIDGSITLADANGNSATAVLRGAIANERPTAVAAASVIDSCEGTVRLDASGSTDPDGDVLGYQWWRGTEGSADYALVGYGRTLDQTVGFGTHTFTLRVFDSVASTSTDVVSVTVNKDTSGPAIDIGEGAVCLWSPNHYFARLELGDEIPVQATDTCDGAVQAVVVAVESSQPANDVGDGDTEQDFAFGDQAVCLRSERQGTDLEGRVYSVTLRATDSDGNSTEEIVEIRVPHDLGDASCDVVVRPDAEIDAATCTAETGGFQKARSGARGVLGLCSVQLPGAGSSGSLPWLALVGLVAVIARRRRAV